MTDVQKCDACGDVALAHGTEFRFSHAVADIEAHRDAIDVRRNGHLCDECAREVARLIQSLGDE